MATAHVPTVEDITAHLDAARELFGALDPALLPDCDVATAFDAIVETQKLVEGASVRMAARYEEVGAWKRSGAKSAGDDIARKTGTSAGRARKRLSTSHKLRERPKTDEALRRGELSDDQADHVASGADASPADEDELLEAARRKPLHELKRKAAEARAKADRDREATRSRQHQARRVSRWIDEEGMYNLHLRGPGDWGAEIDAVIKQRVDRIFADARDAGRFEPFEAYLADAVRALLLGRNGGGDAGADAPSRGSQAVRAEKKVIATIDVTALNRGRVADGETCEIAGIGPVSVSAVRSLLSDAFLALVITDGEDIVNVTHLGRQVTAKQRTALELRGYRCEVEGCGATHQLEIDHVTGWTLTKITELDDLAWLCPHDHDHKTRNDLILLGPPGRRRFTPRPPNTSDPPRGSPIQDDVFTAAR